MIKKILKKIVAVAGYKIIRENPKIHPQLQKPISPEHFFDMYFSLIKKDNFFFLQIGANDGKHDDLLHKYIIKYHLKGLLVEPQKDILERLKKTYKGYEDNLIFANIGVSKENGTRDLFRIKPELITQRGYYEATAIASFDVDSLRTRIKKRFKLGVFKAISDNPDDYIESIEVKTQNLNTLLKENGVEKFDFIFIDCEKYDFEIIKMIDFEKFSPGVIYYESILLSDEDRESCEELLKSRGYNLFRTGNDTCAFRT